MHEGRGLRQREKDDETCNGTPSLVSFFVYAKNSNFLVQIHYRLLVSRYELDDFTLTQLINPYPSFQIRLHIEPKYCFLEFQGQSLNSKQ